MVEKRQSLQSGVILKIRGPRCKLWIRALAFMIIFCFVYQGLTSKAGPDYATTLNLIFQRPAPLPTNPLMAFFCGNAYAVDNGGDYTPPAAAYSFDDYVPDPVTSRDSYGSYVPVYQPPAVMPSYDYMPTYTPSPVEFHLVDPSVYDFSDTSSYISGYDASATTSVYDSSSASYSYDSSALTYVAPTNNSSTVSVNSTPSNHVDTSTFIPSVFTYNPTADIPDVTDQFNLGADSYLANIADTSSYISGDDVSASTSVSDNTYTFIPSAFTHNPTADISDTSNQFNLGADDYLGRIANTAYIPISTDSEYISAADRGFADGFSNYKFGTTFSDDTPQFHLVDPSGFPDFSSGHDTSVPAAVYDNSSFYAGISNDNNILTSGVESFGNDNHSLGAEFNPLSNGGLAGFPAEEYNDNGKQPVGKIATAMGSDVDDAINQAVRDLHAGEEDWHSIGESIWDAVQVPGNPLASATRATTAAEVMRDQDLRINTTASAVSHYLWNRASVAEGGFSLISQRAEDFVHPFLKLLLASYGYLRYGTFAIMEGGRVIGSPPSLRQFRAGELGYMDGLEDSLRLDKK
ncbi:MAG: hypothetical protein ABIE75_02135 [Candidatus Omnitrophota bacterium]